MTEKIDAFSHVLTEDVYEALQDIAPSHDKHPPDLLFLENVDERIEHLDRLGVDRQVITQAEPRVWPHTTPDADEALEATRLGNDEIRRYADENPDRFVPVGTVPFLTGEYVDEFERCVNELDMAGIQIFSNINGKLLDDEEFYPFFEAVNDADVPVWIHPQFYQWQDFDPEDHWIYNMIGWPFDSSVAIARLVFNGVLDEFENLEIITHHLGGVLPYLDERMHSWVQTRQEYAGTDHAGTYTGTEAIESLSEPIDSYFDRVYADTAVSSQRKQHTLESGYEFFGPDNVLFGADLPFGPGGGVTWMENTIPSIENMDIPESEKEQIFAGNIKSLID